MQRMKRNKEVQKVNPGARERQAVPISYKTPAVFLCSLLWIIVCLFVHLRGIVLHALLQFTASDCRFGNYNVFLSIYRKIENSLKEVFFLVIVQRKV
jgi:hypothetical protein